MYYGMPRRLLRSGDTPTTVFGIQYFVLVPPNTEVENEVTTTRGKKKIINQTLGLKHKQKKIVFFLICI